MKQNLADRFWSKVDTAGGPDACWPWTANRTSVGYGRFKMNGRYHTATHIALLLTSSLPLPGFQVMHMCDNPSCCNPAHLRVGTATDNMRDCAKKGRNPMQNPTTRAKLSARLSSPDARERLRQRTVTRKLTWEQVRAIRALWQTGAFTQTVIAVQFGVTKGAISFIIRNKTWPDAQYCPAKDESTP